MFQSRYEILFVRVHFDYLPKPFNVTLSGRNNEGLVTRHFLGHCLYNGRGGPAFLSLDFKS